MRVLHVIDSLALAGAETLVKDLALESRALGVLSEVYALRTSGAPLERMLRDQEVRVVSGDLGSVYDPRHIGRLARHLRSHHYDVVHVHLFPAQLWAAMVPLVKGGTKSVLVTTEHNTENRRRRWMWKSLDRKMYAKYSAVVCIGSATRERLVGWLPELASRTPVVENGIDVARFARASALPRAVVGIGGGALILCVGRFDRQKGQDTLIRALSKLDNVRLALVGDGVRRDEMVRLAKEVGVSTRVHFLGVRSDVPEIMKAADVYVQPSLWEGFGIAALEAMAAGLPVVASDVPGLADLVDEAGILVPAANPERLAEALRELLDNPTRRREIAGRCAKRAPVFDISRTAERYCELYRRLLAAEPCVS